LGDITLSTIKPPSQGGSQGGNSRKGGFGEDFKTALEGNSKKSVQSDKSAASKTSSNNNPLFYSIHDRVTKDEGKRFFERAMTLADENKFNVFPLTRKIRA